MPTDKKILSRGLKYLGWALPLFFIGPIIINSSFKNQQHVFFYMVLGLGIIACLAAMYLMFIGLKTVVKSIF